MAADPSQAMMAFTESLSFDQELRFEDIAGSEAHVRGLGRAGILGTDHVEALLDALSTVRKEFENGTFHFSEGDEDIHTAIERRVTELAGEAGARLHTARSRNDQVATALRLYTRRRIAEVGTAVLDLCDALIVRAKGAEGLELPGYTHLQRAQRVPLALQLLAHGWGLLRDLDRLADTRRRLDVSPLGAGALGGSSLPLDPEWVAGELGFSGTFANSIDAVSDRDFVAETLFDLALIGVHLSRLGEEIVIYSSTEFGFYGLDDAWATGSSMLPNKKNPDVAELARGKSGRLIGHLTGLLATLKGLPFAYNRDLQEDKAPLFDGFNQVLLALVALRGVIETLHFNEEAMRRAAADPALRAVDLAEWLVARGIPFRQAHGLVAEIVRRSSEGSVSFRDLVAAEPSLGDEAARLFDEERPRNRGSIETQIASFAERTLFERERIETGDGR